MSENRGCYSEKQLNECDFMSKDEITLTSIIDSSIRLKDKYWFVCKKLLSKEQNQQLAIGFAEIVLKIYEKKYPENKAPREAIQAAKDYLAGIINIDELRRKRAAAAYAADAADAYAAAAAAAYAAAYAAAAADAAAAYAAADAADDAYADAAYAADAADADAAAYAAYAADAASYAAYAYAAADYGKNKFNTALKGYLPDFCKNNLPEYF